jgi:hypothetical protein
MYINVILWNILMLFFLKQRSYCSTADPDASFGNYDIVDDTQLEPVTLQLLRVHLNQIKEGLNDHVNNKFSELADEFRGWALANDETKMRPKNFAPQGELY